MSIGKVFINIHVFAFLHNCFKQLSHRVYDTNVIIVRHLVASVHVSVVMIDIYNSRFIFLADLSIFFMFFAGIYPIRHWGGMSPRCTHTVQDVSKHHHLQSGIISTSKSELIDELFYRANLFV